MTRLELYKAERERAEAAAEKSRLSPTTPTAQNTPTEHCVTKDSAAEEIIHPNQTSSVQTMPTLISMPSSDQPEPKTSNQASPISDQNANKKMEILSMELKQAKNRIRSLEGENENYRIEAEVLEAENQMMGESLEEASKKAKAAESQINHLSNQLTWQSKSRTPSKQSRIFSRRLLRWKQRLASNPVRVWRKLKLPEQNLPRFGTIEQTTRQITADTRLQETTEQTSAQLNATERKIRELTQKANAELTSARSETARLQTLTKKLEATREQCERQTTDAESRLKDQTNQFQLFRAKMEKFKAQTAEELKTTELSALEYQLTLNEQRETELQTLKKESVKMAEQIELIPRRIREAKEAAVSSERKAERRVEWTARILQWSIVPLILVTMAAGCYLGTSKDLSENLAAQQRRTDELQQKLLIAQEAKTKTEENFRNTEANLRLISPEVEQFYNQPPAEQAKILQTAWKHAAARQKKRRR